MINLIVIALSLTTGTPAKMVASNLHISETRDGAYVMRVSNPGTLKHTPRAWEQPQVFRSDEGYDGTGPAIANKGKL